MKPETKPETKLCLWRDNHGHVALELARNGKFVMYTCFRHSRGLVMHKMTEGEFKRSYFPVTDYPVKRGLEYMVQHAGRFGASEEILTALELEVGPLDPAFKAKAIELQASKVVTMTDETRERLRKLVEARREEKRSRKART